MDHRQPLKLCIVFLTACAVILGGVYFVRGNAGMGLLVALTVALVDIVYLARRKAANLVSLITRLLSKLTPASRSFCTM